MLHPIAPQLTLHKDAYFLDSQNQQLYFLKQGNLYTHNLISKIQQHISISLPTNQPQITQLPQLITLEGETITNVDRNIIAANSESVALRGSTQISDGSFWEWHIPLTLEGIQLGVCEVKENEIIKNQLIIFNSSTARTVTFSLRGSELAFWVNGTKPAKGSSKTLSFELGINKIHPYARLKGKGSVLAFIPFTSMPQLISISRFNPFGKLWLDQPAQSEQIDFKCSKQVIKQLIHLSPDRFLLVWQNNRARIYYRNTQTKQFNFDPLVVQGEYIQNFFTQSQYLELKNSNQFQTLFKKSSTLNINNSFEWIRYLISKLDSSKSQRDDLYIMLLQKLVAIRPYLTSSASKIPNLIIQSEEDSKKYYSSLKYFDFSNKINSSTLVTSFRDFVIEGSLEDITSNYLVSKKENTVVIYYIGDYVKEVFRENIQPIKSLSKSNITETYEEDDLRSLKSDGSFLYKILIGCLSKDKKNDQVHSVNQQDVEELQRDFGIEQNIAQTALEITGNLQEALVLIYTQKDQIFRKKQDSIKHQNEINRSSISLLQTPSIFTRLILLMDNTLFLLGISPKSIKSFVYRGQNQYVDLVYFKHQNSLQDIAYQNWYKTSNHALLHILQNHQLKQTPMLLFKQSGKYFCLQNRQNNFQKRELKIHLQNIYESKNAISTSEPQLSSLVLQQQVVRSITGELICHSAEQNPPNTVVLVKHTLLTNLQHKQNNTIRIIIKTEETLPIPTQQTQQIILLTVESGPPGINKNYSISNILLPNSFFLANYPHGYKLRQLHNKVINISSLKIKRSVNRKNINYIVDGTIQFRDIWGNKSKLYPFSFHENQQEVSLNFIENKYWKEIIVSPNYTLHKKLPFEIGSISAFGTTLSQQTFYQQTYEALSILLSSLTLKTNILNFKFIQPNIVSLDLTIPSLQNVQNAFNGNQKIKIISKKSIILDEAQSYNAYFQRISPNLNGLTDNQVRKYIDLVFNNSNLTDQQQQISIFNKIWQNSYGQQYLISLSNSPTEVPIIPLPYLKLLISKLDQQKIQAMTKTILSAISSTRSKQYQTIKNSELPYLYFQTDLYSEYYYMLINPSKLEAKHNLYPQPVIKSDIIVFKTENSRRIIIKLPSEYRITNFTLKFQRCEITAKLNYKIFKLLPRGQEEIGSGRILEQQWTQITKFSEKTEVQQHYGNNSKLLNIIGLDVSTINAQYIQIQLDFTETGILSHQNQSGKIPQTDILPQLYGYELGPSSPLQSIQQIFTMQPQDMFFLSLSPLGKYPIQKYSVSKGKNTQFLYFTPQNQDISHVHRLLQQKIAKLDYESIVSIQSKLINCRSFSCKVSLDYLYTLLCLCGNQLLKNEVMVNDDLCNEIFTKIVQVAQGPIKIIGFKIISHKIPLLLKSLQYIQTELPSLGTISFSYQQLLEVLDFNNTDLCKSLTRLILRGVAYNQQWVELLIKMSHLTQSHSEIVAYFIDKQDWLQNHFILQYLFTLPEEQFLKTFLDSISYGKLSKLVLTPNAKPRRQMLLNVIVERASIENPVDLDVVSLIFQQQEIRWQQLQRVISCCPQATDIIIHQFLQSQNSASLAKEHGILLSTAALPKYSQEFALFLDKIYRKNKAALAEIFLSLNGKCTSLHYDFLDTLSSFIVDQCSVGGVEGARLISEKRLSSLLAAVQMLKVTQKLPQGADLPNEDLIISWYLRNNSYQFTSTNPASRPPAYHLIRQLVELVLQLLRTVAPVKVLAQYSSSLQNIKHSRKLSLTQRHLLFNQIHHGVTELLSLTLTPGALAQVLVGAQNPLLSTVINQLKANSLKSSSRTHKWVPGKEVDLTQKFTVPDFPDARDLQMGKSGTKSPSFKIPLAQKVLKLQSQDLQQPSKFIIGFILNDHVDNKTAILPSRIELHCGNQESLVKIGDMFPIEDQFYLQFGVKLFGLNLNSSFSLGSHSFKNLEFHLHEPTLSSANDLLETGQRSKKGATFNLSFISIYGYDTQPTEEPDYSHLYITLLGFLGQKKYQQDLKSVVGSPQFDQKLELVIQVLNDLLPNNQIEQLLLALNIAGEGILEHVLRSKGANPRLVNLLVMGRLTKDNISKLITYTLENISQEFVNIVTLSLRLASYSKQQSVNQPYSNFDNVKLLLQKYEQSKGQNKKLYRELLSSIATVPNLYRYQIGKLKQLIWNKKERQLSYPILAAILPYYPTELELFSSNGSTLQLFEEIVAIMQSNKNSTNIIKDPSNHLTLLCTLVLNNSSRKLLLEKKAPLTLVQLLKSNKSLLVRYQNLTMKLLINFFQSTCIGTNCQDEFGQILISLMTSLNDFDTIHHQYFIHRFFFPLINAFKGIPVIFVWKHDKEYLKQPTDILKKKPIKSSMKVIQYEQDFYHPIDNLDPSNLQQSLLFVTKQKNVISYRLSGSILEDIVSKKNRKYSIQQGNIVVQIASEKKIILSNEQFLIYQQNTWEKHLLTNATLTSLDNPWILQENYRTTLSLKQSTPERVYFVPQEIQIGQLLKQFNIGGLRIHPTDLSAITPINYYSGQVISQKTQMKNILASQKESYLKIQIQTSSLFNNTTIEGLAQGETSYQSFVPQETIFKAFEQKKGLEKMITVLKGCVKNWASSQQSNIWGQYLKELESYSCFPVFSSLYMTKQQNVGLLFDLLLGQPDKQDNKKWLQRQKQSVKQLYMIIKDVFAVKGEQAVVVRQYALKSGFYSTMLQRLYLITKENKRFKNQDQKEEQKQELVIPVLQQKLSQQDYKIKLQKKKGVGYGTDSSTNQKWDLTGHQQARKQKSQQILGLLKILEQFFDYKEFAFPPELLDKTYQSSLLPILESSLRGGSLLQISKFADLFQGELSFIQVIARCKNLLPTLMPIPKCYEPKQPESIYSLLKTLNNTSKIFISCLTGSASQKVSEQIAKKIITTFEIVEQAVEQYQTSHNEQDQQKKILELPLAKKYPLLLKDLRFDYTDMKDNGKITKHHYSSSYQAGHKPPVEKTIRLAQELADISHALPIQHTNAIFVRCDKERVDFMQALIMGSNGTPYGHGAYLFDIHFQDNYPNGPPKVNLTTTGNGQIRFNPNLYACGKVCLSLLGTWRGNATENWDAKVSTLLQVLVSIQSIIMSEDIYFNEPGFEHQQGTAEGEKKNQAYANIVRYGNIKYAMIENIKNPPKGFQSIIKRHFYLKKDEILQQCQKWLKLAQKRQASYNGLVSDHNYSWCTTFKKSKTQYKTMLQKAIKQLQVQINKLQPPTHQDFKKQSSPTKKKKKQLKVIKQVSIDPQLQEIDVSYGGAQTEFQELDINDQKVKDRWSRYIGAMGVQAVSKQSKANILILGLGGIGVEIAKNIILSGCRQLALWDDKKVGWQDLSSQFFLGDADVGQSRLDSTYYKLQQLNHYVKLTKLQYNSEDFSNISKFQVIIATERNHLQLIRLNSFCRKNNIHFISVDCYGPYGQIFNDFGDSFEILDKNGQDTIQILLEEITIAEKGLVKLLKGLRHPFEDGESIRISGVKGMKLLTNDSLSINGTIHKIQVVDQSSFYIGDTTIYSNYEGEGSARNIKTVNLTTFKSLQTCTQLQNIDSNLQYYDWAKSGKLKLLHLTFIALSTFKIKHSRLPLAWNREEARQLVQIVKQKRADLTVEQQAYISLFSYTCSGTFGPMCAFFGGIASQEAFKAITGKYTPINQYFLAQFSEIIQSLPQEQAWETFIKSHLPVLNRTEGLRRVVGEQLLKRIENCRVFMIGSGAIGCELLKNFAMLELGVGQNGSIVVTDPDHIETSNLNRQFLFRQKHLRKPKSATASAAVVQMNPRLKGHIKPRLEKVCEATKDIFSNQFFESQTIIANALDNVEARRYVDSRCVQNKIPLLESGTLSSKGHVQVIIPYKTQTYGSKQDPNDAQGDIPHCTLKMFPQQTLHCVEWARDLFGKQFTLGPKALQKLIQQQEKYVPVPSDIQMLQDCIKLIKRRPSSFDDAIEATTNLFYQVFRNDIMQLLYTYPLDAKTKDGKPFWKLPKRPPVPIEEIIPADPLHATFIASYSVLLAKVYNIPYPKDFRDPKRREEIAQTASQIKVEPFVPSDKLAKEMAEEVNKDNNPGQNENIQNKQLNEGDENSLFNKYKSIYNEIKENGQTIQSKPEQFQKDEDQNGHIDLIYSMANLRSRNYKLEEMDWINVKIKAGRIMPALSTTTSCIAALQTIQLIKYLRGCPLQTMRNAFINLAVPYMQLGEPGAVEKIKVHQNLETTLWQRWSIGPISKLKTLEEFMKAIEEKYGVVVKGLSLTEGEQIYSDFVFSLQSKKAEKEKLMGKQLQSIVSEQVGQQSVKYVDFTLVMGVGQTLIKHAPTLRLLLEP